MSIPEIAEKLGVAYVVEGSVRKAGNRVRITAQLIKAADGFHVWSENFDRELKDIFAVQDEIAGLIAKNLALRLGTGSSGPTIAAAPTKNLEAFDLYLRGRALQTGGQSNVTMLEGVRLYEEAVQLDPSYALAWARLAQTFIQMQGGFDQSEQTGTKARRAAATALKLAPDLPEARLAMAAVQLFVDHDLEATQRELDHAERISAEHCRVGRIARAAAGVPRQLGRGIEPAWRCAPSSSTRRMPIRSTPWGRFSNGSAALPMRRR